jgi:hypothetical protein
VHWSFTSLIWPLKSQRQAQIQAVGVILQAAVMQLARAPKLSKRHTFVLGAICGLLSAQVPTSRPTIPMRPQYLRTASAHLVAPWYTLYGNFQLDKYVDPPTTDSIIEARCGPAIIAAEKLFRQSLVHVGRNHIGLSALSPSNIR